MKGLEGLWVISPSYINDPKKTNDMGVNLSPSVSVSNSRAGLALQINREVKTKNKKQNTANLFIWRH